MVLKTSSYQAVEGRVNLSEHLLGICYVPIIVLNAVFQRVRLIYSIINLFIQSTFIQHHLDYSNKYLKAIILQQLKIEVTYFCFVIKSIITILLHIIYISSFESKIQTSCSWNHTDSVGLKALISVITKLPRNLNLSLIFYILYIFLFQDIVLKQIKIS